MKIKNLLIANLACFALMVFTLSAQNTEINVMVLFTQTAGNNLLNYEDPKSAPDEIQEAIDYTNQAFTNSQVLITLNSIHVAEIDFTPSGNDGESLEWLKLPTDGIIDEVHAWRDQYAADIVVVISQGGSASGIGGWSQGNNRKWESEAFAIINVGNDMEDMDNRSFAHEIGHILGAQHDWYTPPIMGLFNGNETMPSIMHNHGYTYIDEGTNTGFYTIMAYSSMCYDKGATCNAIPYFSNPDVTYNGIPTGIEKVDPIWNISADCYCGCQNVLSAGCPADNADIFNWMASTVASYRSSQGPDGPVTNLTAFHTGGAAVSLTWSESISNEDGFYIYRSVDNGMNYILHDSVVAGATNYNDDITSAIVNAKPWIYRVQAFNAYGLSTFDQDSVNIIISCGSIDEGFETGDFSSFTWVNTSSYPWFIADRTDITGKAAKGSESLPYFGWPPQEGTPTIEVTLEVESGFMCFSMKADVLTQFSIDEVYPENASSSYTEGWDTVAVYVQGGTRKFSWEFFGGGNGWLDDICFPPIVSSCIVTIPDTNFKNALLNHTPVIDLNDDGKIQCDEAAAYNDTINVNNMNISDLTGIGAFTALTGLVCSHNQLATLNINSNTALTSLNCSYNQVSNLNLSANTALVSLTAASNLLTSIDVSANTQLAVLNLWDNNLTDIDVSFNTALTDLVLNENFLTDIDISNNPALTEIGVSFNSLSSLDLSSNPVLEILICDNNQITSLGLSSNPDLNILWAYDNLLTGIDVSDKPNLAYFEVQNNNLTNLNVANGNNSNFYTFKATGNIGLTCIQVDNPTWANTNWSSYKDAGAVFSDDCVCNIPAAVSSNGPVCIGDVLALTASPQGMTSYVWEGPQNFASNVQNPEISDSATVAMIGNYQVTVTDWRGCTAIASTNAQVQIPYSSGESYVICSGESYTWHGNDYNSAGIYYDSLTTVYGCDSIYTLTLTVLPSFRFQETHEICDGESYEWRGNSYSSAGVYTDNHITAEGCDSIYELTLDVHPAYFIQEFAEICNGASYTWHDSAYTETGVYPAIYSSVFGCDSSYSLVLTVTQTPEAYAGTGASYLENHDGVQLGEEATPGYSYAWSPSDGLSNPSISNPLASPLETTIYYVTVTNGLCFDVDQVTIVFVPTFDIAGIITYDDTVNTAMNNVAVSLQQNDTTIETIVTNTSGAFTFADYPAGEYTMEAISTKIWGGVNSTDALLVQLYYAGLGTLTEPRPTAADVNLSTFVNSTDALLIKRRFAGLDTSFAAGDWYFNPRPVVIDSADVEMDFRAICFGDVNGSYTPPFAKTTGPVVLTSNGTLPVTPGSVIDIPVSVGNVMQTGAASLIFTYQQEIEVLSVNPVTAGLTGLINNIANGKVFVAWSSLQSINLQEDDILLSIQVRVIADNGKEITFGLLPESEFADPVANIITGVNLYMPSLTPVLTGTTPVGADEISVYPNPATGRVYISNAAGAAVSITDVIGRQVFYSNACKSVLTSIDLSGFSEGSYIVKIVKSDMVVTNKLVVKK